ICDRSTFRFVVVVVLVIGIIASAKPIVLGASLEQQSTKRATVESSTNPGAQTSANAPQTKANEPAKTQAQEPIPPDHYDPDDVKTYADVRNEEKVVTVQGRP